MSGSNIVPPTLLAPPPGRSGEGASGRTDRPLKRLAIHLMLAGAAIIAAFPIVRVLGVALRPGNRLLDSHFSLIPDGATLDAFRHVLGETDLPLWLFNSMVVTTGTAIVGVIVAATSAYAFSRFKFPGRGVGLTTLLATQLIPAAMLLVPIYILAVQFKLANTYVGMVIGLSVTSVPFSIWILKGYHTPSRRARGGGPDRRLSSWSRSTGSSCRLHPAWRASSCSILAAWKTLLPGVSSQGGAADWPLPQRFIRVQTQWNDSRRPPPQLDPVIALLLMSNGRSAYRRGVKAKCRRRPARPGRPASACSVMHDSRQGPKRISNGSGSMSPDETRARFEMASQPRGPASPADRRRSPTAALRAASAPAVPRPPRGARARGLPACRRRAWGVSIPHRRPAPVERPALRGATARPGRAGRGPRPVRPRSAPRAAAMRLEVDVQSRRRRRRPPSAGPPGSRRLRDTRRAPLVGGGVTSAPYPCASLLTQPPRSSPCHPNPAVRERRLYRSSPTGSRRGARPQAGAPSSVERADHHGFKGGHPRGGRAPRHLSTRVHGDLLNRLPVRPNHRYQHVRLPAVDPLLAAMPPRSCSTLHPRHAVILTASTTQRASALNQS